MLNKHHIIPKHMKNDGVMEEMGLDNINDPLNLTPPISPELHAAFHKDLYDHYSKKEDLCAQNIILNDNRIDISGKNHPFYGKHHTDESNKQNRMSHIGKIPWNKGKIGIYSKETLEKMSLKKLGTKASEKTKRILSEKRKNNNNNSRNWIITYPDKQFCLIYNLHKFSKEMGLNTGHMVQVSKGTISQHKGFVCQRVQNGYSRKV